MTFSVGILYSTQTLLEAVAEGGIDSTNLAASFTRIDVADAKIVLSTAQRCRWIRIEDDGTIRLTERGGFIRGLSGPRECLREQLYDLLVSDTPVWARLMIKGRFETLKAMPADAMQCFEDCELTSGIDDETVSWWDRASGSVRSERARALYEIGRKAERYSLSFEKLRTGKEPIWQAMETNVSGFDVLSVVDSNSTTKLKIEVKGSGMRKSEASFFVTRNEWNTATKSTEYYFHLWLLKEPRKLFVVPASKVEDHIPKDAGSGRWNNTELFFREFGDFEQSLSS